VTADAETIDTGAVGRSAAVVSAGIVGAQIIGVVRELWLASHIGLSGELDALLVSLGLTTIVAGLITGGATGALVPLYLEARTKNGRDDARSLSGATITWLGVIGVLLSIGMAALAPVLITISGPGLQPDDHALATEYLRRLTPVMFITVVTTMLRVVCQAEERFGWIAGATVAGPAVTVLIMLVFWGPLQLDSLVLGTIVGSVATLLVFVYATARVQALPIPRLQRDPRLVAMFRHAGPVTVSVGILEFRGIVDRAVATLLGPGSVSALRYAMVLIQPLAQIGPAWSSVIYPRLVHLSLNTRLGSLAGWAEQWLRAAVAIFVPIATLTAAVAPLAVFVAYGRGAFTVEDRTLTAQTLAAYAPILVTLMMLPILVGSLNARRRGGMLLLGGTINVILNVVLDLAFAYVLGAPGIALSTSLTEVIVVVIFIRWMARTDAFDLRPLVRTIVLSAFAIAPFALVIAALCWAGFGQTDLIGAIITLGVLGAIGVVGYVTLASWVGIDVARRTVEVLVEQASRVRAIRGRS
jgi:putative peptidoglycan lipid II flippase